MAAFDHEFQLLHFAGSGGDIKQLTTFYERHGIAARVKVAEKRMDYAWRSADLAIVRAGAGTIAEQIEFEVPAIYIPYPHAADGHQESNAAFVVKQLQGGWQWSERLWQPECAAAELAQLLAKDSAKRTIAKQNLARYKQVTPGVQLSTLLLSHLQQA
jgi:UDP-N-acetylglucosamine--N-acetylmuramyl-(pentapeptide) pyrophosphoryl-undecaprenol N-acetylglucosamine transferase